MTKSYPLKIQMFQKNNNIVESADVQIDYLNYKKSRRIYNYRLMNNSQNAVDSLNSHQ